MSIEVNKVVSLSYQLTVEGQVLDQTDTENPLEFIFGAGMMIPGFERQLEGLNLGDKYAFDVQPEEGYGIANPEEVVELPKDIFMEDGEQVANLTLGALLPMQDNQGNQLQGRVVAVTDTVVSMDFNHPLADKVLSFTGEIVGIREATQEELDHGHVHGEGDDHHH